MATNARKIPEARVFEASLEPLLSTDEQRAIPIPDSSKNRTMPPRDGQITLEQALQAAARLCLKVPATRLELDIAYKRTANRFSRYLAQHHGIVGRRSWPLYRRYWRAYELLQRFVHLVDAGWRWWVPPAVTRSEPEPVQGPPPKPPDVLEADREWEQIWGGLELWSTAETRSSKEEEALEKMWEDVKKDISRA